eukprot:scaffold19587_cov174-Isochrysis_galbana.AAC.1
MGYFFLHDRVARHTLVAMAVAVAAVAFAFLPTVLHSAPPAGVLPAESAEPKGEPALARGATPQRQSPHAHQQYSPRICMLFNMRAAGAASLVQHWLSSAALPAPHCTGASLPHPPLP